MGKTNPFDKKVTSSKFDVLGRKVKGSTGAPGIAKKRDIEARRKTLVQEYKQRNAVGSFLDKRIGEKDFRISEEDKMTRRFAREKMRLLQKKHDKKSLFNLDSGLVELTHKGRHLGDMDDLDEEDMRLSESGDESDRGQVDKADTKAFHFGGFADSNTGKRKSKSEVMKEVMAKSKFFKFQRQQINEENAGLCEELNEEFDAIRSMLDFSEKEKDVKDPGMLDYDKHVHELVYEKRAQPKDRLKTEYEIAAEEREKLIKEEDRKQRRMRGEESDTEQTKKVSADSLEDNFVTERPRLTIDDIYRLEREDEVDDDEDEEEEEEDDDDDDDEEEEDDEEEDDEEEDKDKDERDKEKENDEKENNGEMTLSKGRKKKLHSAVDEEKFNDGKFPATFEAFIALFDTSLAESCSKAVARLKTLYHPSLHQSNKEKLSSLVGLMFDLFFHLLKTTKSIDVIADLVPTCNSLVQQFPIKAADYFRPRLGSLSAASNTEFLLTSMLICHIFSTSDFKHHVVSPWILILNQKLENLEFRKHEDVVFGLMLCDIYMQSQADSRRVSPEVINALCQIVDVYFQFERPCFPRKGDSALQLDLSGDRDLTLRHLMLLDSVDDSFNRSIFEFSLKAVEKLSNLYSDTPAFVEIFGPILGHLQKQSCKDAKIESLIGKLQKQMSTAASIRAPLQYQRHKPIPLQTLAPKFEFGYSLDRKYDERDEVKKLKGQVKKEMRGAMRELRKDNLALAEEKRTQQRKKDTEYREKLKSIYSTLSSDQAQAKKMGKRRR